MFDKFIKNKSLLKYLESKNITFPTDIQKEVFKSFDDYNNLIIKSKTGSGKTLAFLLPILDRYEDTNDVFATIIVPTSILALQIYNVLKEIQNFFDKKLTIRIYNQSTNAKEEVVKLEEKQPNIVISTPGKLTELSISCNALKIYKSKYFVIDEADMTLDKTYIMELANITKILKDAKTILLSATYNMEVFSVITSNLLDYNVIDLNDELTNKIEHILIPVKHHNKIDLLVNLINIINPYLCIIYVSQKKDIEEVYKAVVSQNKNTTYIHGDLPIRERKRIINDINNLKYQFVVSSDITARGIDIYGVSHIISYDLPFDYEFYIHRVGRTGRNNSTGVSYALFERVKDVYLDNLEQKGITFKYKEIKDNQLVDAKERNTRQKREIPIKNYHETAAKHIPKAKKVKPGYKKKRKEEIEKLAKKLKKNEFKTKKYYY